MLIHVSSSRPSVTSGDIVVWLRPDNWDDWFSYETTFQANIYFVEWNEMGEIKIGIKEIPVDYSHHKIVIRDLIPSRPTDHLDENFFSVGLSTDYYTQINDLLGDNKDSYYKAMNDIAFNNALFKKVKNLDITSNSLFRSISELKVSRQFARIATGGIPRSVFEFTYFFPKSQMGTRDISFKVNPDSQIPTNIHAIIGRNGVGKTKILNEIITSFINESYKPAEREGYSSYNSDNETTFANIIQVSFSVFDCESWDDVHAADMENSFGLTRYYNIGLSPKTISGIVLPEGISSNKLFSFYLWDKFVDSYIICRNSHKIDGTKEPTNKWNMLEYALDTLSEDDTFQQASIRDWESKYIALGENIKLTRELPELSPGSNLAKVFNHLSSGHKIVLLSIVEIIAHIEECSLVLLDEPESHLHPPLLSLYIKALSHLLTSINAACLIVTHSPVVLQEIPKECVWILLRSADNNNALRPRKETYGENIDALITEVFSHNVMNSTFLQTINEMLALDQSFSVENFKMFGLEAQSLMLLKYREKGYDNEPSRLS